MDHINAICKTSQILVKLFHVLFCIRRRKKMTDKKTYGICCRLNLQCCRLNLQSSIFIVWCTNLIMILSFCLFSNVYVDVLMHERKVWVKKSNFAGESSTFSLYVRNSLQHFFVNYLIMMFFCCCTAVFRNVL